MRKWNTSEIIDQFMIVHGNKYEYSEVNYVNINEKVKIICEKHGIFEQTPKVHKRGHGCPSCSGNKKKTSDDFIKESNNIHNNKYDYNMVKYINNMTKIDIICSEHGPFKQIPKDHLNGSGCPKCENRYNYNTKEMIDISKEIHGNDKYGYDEFEYFNLSTKVKIRCFSHGIFETTPRNHIHNKSGCPKCGKLESSNKQRKDISQLERELSMLDNGYIYPKLNDEYNNNRSKITIICKKHGIFKQSVNSHLGGNNCPKCNISKGESEISKNLNLMGVSYIYNYRFEDCRNKRPLPFDFYCPEKNLCIEFDGKQHFYPVDHYGGKKGLVYRKFNDNIKNEYCEDNDIKLIRIPYWEIGNIGEIISSLCEESKNNDIVWEKE